MVGIQRVPAGNVILLVTFYLFAPALVSGQMPLTGQPIWSTSELDMISTGMMWRDFNNDGYIDVFFSNGNDIEKAPNTAYLQAYGRFTEAANWSSSNREYSGHCAVGDIDDNGLPDVVVSNYLGPDGFSSLNRQNLYFNYTGRPASSPGWYSADSMFSFSCALGDIDNDGDLDLAVATGESYTNVLQRDRIYFNIDGSLQTTPGWQSDIATTTYDVFFGDVDNDGDLDLAAAHENVPVAVYYNNNGSIETTPSWQAGTIESSNTILLGDVNDDGWLDLLIAYNDQLGGSGKFRLHLNNGAGTFHVTPDWESATGGFGSALALYDVDRDGDRDLAAGRWFDQPRIYENIGGTFSTSPVWQADLSTVPEELAFVDLDGNGVEPMVDRILLPGNRKLFYTEHNPLYALDSVRVDGAVLGPSDYCYDLFSGWLSLAGSAADSVEIFYKYSFTNDLAVANWDTVNLVYGSTLKPNVDIYADTTVGWAPLTVQFTDSTPGAYNWYYAFGDGEESIQQHPQHTYDSGGIYDITAANMSPAGVHSRTIRSMIFVLADTLAFRRDTVTPGAQAIIDVVLTNTQPVQDLILPIELPEIPVDIKLDSVVRGSRTDYFDHLSFLTYNHTSDAYRFTVDLNPGSLNPPLPAGTGPVLRLFVTTAATAAEHDSVVVDTFASGAYLADMTTPFMQFQPVILGGLIYFLEFRRADVTGDGLVDISDLTWIVNYLFIWADPPPEPPEADVNNDGVVDIADLTYLVNYLFLMGPDIPG